MGQKIGGMFCNYMRIADFRLIGEEGETVAATFDFWGKILGQKIGGMPEQVLQLRADCRF